MYKQLQVALFGVLTLTCAPLLGQEKNAPGAKSPIETGTHRFVSNDEVLTHGDVVTIKRKAGQDSVSGVFVRADPRSGRLFVRPQPGQAPVAVATNDIEKVDRITPTLGRPGNGGIRPAIGNDERPTPTYEIHELEVRNGPYSKFYYYDSSLSPSERQLLMAISRASADVEAKGQQVDLVSRMLHEAIAERVAPRLPVVLAADAFPYAYPQILIVENPLTANPVYLVGYSAVVPTPVVVKRWASAESLADLSKNLRDAEAAFAEARKVYETARERAIYEPAGHIIAVRLED
jgi:hypothetical protein